MLHVIVPILPFCNLYTHAHETGWGKKQYTNTDDNATTTMSDSSLTLICLVEGDHIEHAFPVIVEPSEPVGVLKKRIKEEKANDFQHIDADKLILFLHNQPVNTNNDEPIISNGSTKLSAIFGIGEYFTSQPPSKRIHVIVRHSETAITTITTPRIFICIAHFRKVTRAFYFEQLSEDNWIQCQQQIKEVFGEYLSEADSTTIRIQPKTQNIIMISREKDFVSFLKNNSDNKKLEFTVFACKFFYI